MTDRMTEELERQRREEEAARKANQLKQENLERLERAVPSLIEGQLWPVMKEWVENARQQLNKRGRDIQLQANLSPAPFSPAIAIARLTYPSYYVDVTWDGRSSHVDVMIRGTQDRESATSEEHVTIGLDVDERGVRIAGDISGICDDLLMPLIAPPAYR